MPARRTQSRYVAAADPHAEPIFGASEDMAGTPRRSFPSHEIERNFIRIASE